MQISAIVSHLSARRLTLAVDESALETGSAEDLGSDPVARKIFLANLLGQIQLSVIEFSGQAAGLSIMRRPICSDATGDRRPQDANPIGSFGAAQTRSCHLELAGSLACRLVGLLARARPGRIRANEQRVIGSPVASSAPLAAPTRPKQVEQGRRQVTRTREPGPARRALLATKKPLGARRSTLDSQNSTASVTAGRSGSDSSVPANGEQMRPRAAINHTSPDDADLFVWTRARPAGFARLTWSKSG